MGRSCRYRISRSASQVCTQAGIVALISAYLFMSGATNAKDAFPARPLDRAQVLAWMDFGESTSRVKKLIERAGIDFEPTGDYLALLKNLGAPAGFVEAVGKQHPTGAPSKYSPAQQAGFDHLSTCLTMAKTGRFEEAENHCQAATSFEPGVTDFALGEVLIRERKYEAALGALRSAAHADRQRVSKACGVDSRLRGNDESVER